jgi:gliding motility-associated-like protein
MGERVLLFYKKGYFVVFILLILPFFVFGEGIKQLLPDTTISEAGLYIDNSAGTIYADFAVASCPANYRLYIHVKHAGEYILFGIQSNYINVPYNLRKPNGTIALSGILPFYPGQTGYIRYYSQAFAGPYPSYGGYTPLSYHITSSADTGDYYFEIPTSVIYAVEFDLWDFQVVSGQHYPAIPSDAINGRLWSQSWQLYASLGSSPSDYQPFNGTFYVYADDGIVTKLAFSNAAVGAVTIFCNPYGCLNTGNFPSDRQSNNNNTFLVFPGIAQYKVFINNPDSTVYPSGFYGSILGTPSMIPDPNYPPCSVEKYIVVDVNKSGRVEVDITFPYGAPGTNVSLYDSVVPGVNDIPWNGLDGMGNAVPDGTQISVKVIYMNGLTNLPVWDQEMNPDGYIITLVRPANASGLQPPSFWDDSQLVPNTSGDPCNNPPQTVNLTGCTPGSMQGYIGCHPWHPIDGYCHNKMINTWWYGSTTSSNFSCMYTGVVPDPVGHGASHCGPDSLLLHATVLHNETVDWYNISSGGTPLLIGDTSFYTPFITATTTYYAEARNDSSGCESAVRIPVVATIYPLPVPVIAGPSSLCTGATGNLYITQSGMTNYIWNVSSGGTITAGGTSTSNTVTVTWNTTGLQTVSVNYTGVNGCTGMAPAVVNVTIHPLPVPALTGPTTPCVGSMTNVYSTAAGMTNYIWFVSQGGMLLAGGTSTDNTVTVIWNFSGLQSVSVNYTDANGCTATNPTVFPVNVEALPVPTIMGPDSACILSTGNNYNTESGMIFYTWTVSPGGIITSGFGTNSITVTWDSAGPQQVTVLYTNQYGCTAANPTLFNVTVKPLPGIPGNITGPSPVCTGSEGLVYSVPPVTDAISYVWDLPPGFSIISGNGTSTIIVNIDTNASTGNIVVYATNLCGSGQPSPPLTVIVNKPPTGNAGPEGLTCQTTPYTVTQASASNYSVIQWYSNGTGILAGSTTLSPTYTPAPGEIGPVTLTMVLSGNAPCGNDTSKMTLDIEPKASVNAGNDLVTCGQNPVLLSGSSASDYQSLYWTTTGRGVFNDPTILHPTYTPGTSDINAGSIFLTLHATSVEPCGPDSSRVLLTIVRPVYVNAGPDTPVCQDQQFTLSKAIANGYSAITWSTSGDGTFNDSTILNPVYIPGSEDILQGKAILIITADGIYPCSSESDSLVLTINRKPTVHPGPDGSICQGMTYTVGGVSASDFSYFTWESNGKGVLSGTTTLSPVYTPGIDETGTVVLTLEVFGTLSCQDNMVSCEMNVNIYTPVAVNAGEARTIGYDSTATLHAEASGGTGDFKYEWEPSSLLVDDTAIETQTLPLKKDTVFIITVTDKETGCISSDSTKIVVEGPGEGLDSCIVIHNVITPNGDGKNDTWIIDCIENYPENSVQIFNRWGDLVNSFDRYDNTNSVWKGTNKNGKLLPDGTYYYVLQIKNEKARTGWILLRGK